MKNYLKINTLAFILFSIFNIEASLTELQEEKKSNTEVTTTVSQNRSIQSDSSDKKCNLYLCVFFGYFLTCACCCPEFCDEKVIPCIKSTIDCCRCKEIK